MILFLAYAQYVLHIVNQMVFKDLDSVPFFPPLDVTYVTIFCTDEQTRHTATQDQHSIMMPSKMTIHPNRQHRATVVQEKEGTSAQAANTRRQTNISHTKNIHQLILLTTTSGHQSHTQTDYIFYASSSSKSGQSANLQTNKHR